jgi:thiol-disulfide isomerase/thioredoxin
MKRILIVALLIAPLLLLFLAQRSLDYGLRPGDLLPEAQLESLEGVPVETASWRGTPTLLVLFRPECPACREEIRGLGKIAPELREVRIVLLSLKGEPPRDAVPFPAYRDPSGAFVKRTRKLIVPTLYWLDSSGRVRYARAGRRSATSDLQLFRSLLKESHD